MLNSSENSTGSKDNAKNQKRKASAAEVGEGAPARPVKRRASKACQCCRARKVRCNVTEHGAPCTNCRLDEVECIVSESRRKKKHLKEGESNTQNGDSSSIKNSGRSIAARNSIPIHPDLLRKSASVESPPESHVPHSIYQNRLGLNMSNAGTHGTYGSPTPPFAQFQSPIQDYFGGTKFGTVANLPYFIKPLPPKIGPDEYAYLEKKGALTVPSTQLRNELIGAYVDYVHPYMPLLDINDFVTIVESGNGVSGRLSLILYQAVMFAGSAFCDMQHLYNAGYTSRKQARKDLFMRTRLLYDFDYESDRISLVQALLLLTYYYETPDDQKDTWHWMGVATSVAHTIGLHRNPECSDMDPKRTKLWKRIWWSTYMRDRLIALGMRRPTRIKEEDYDVPMITLDDFEFAAIPDSVSCVPMSSTIARDVNKQKKLAVMCVEKAKLCLCISHVLLKQYCVLNNNQGMTNDRTTMMLLPKKLDPETSEVKICDDILQKWYDELPHDAQNLDTLTGDPSIDLHRSLLHLVFYTTLSALHRPQVLPSAPTTGPLTEAAIELLDISRSKVRRAATAITSISQALDEAELVKYLPTTGVTVLIPAIIIHLLDIKSTDEQTRLDSLRGFCSCMAVMNKLRDMYAAADFSTAFLEAAIRKAGIHVSTLGTATVADGHQDQPLHPVTTVEDLVDAGRRLDNLNNPNRPARSTIGAHTLTPPPESSVNRSRISNTNRTVAGFATNFLNNARNSMPAPALPLHLEEDSLANKLNNYLASTPPHSTSSSHSTSSTSDQDHDMEHDHDHDETASLGTTLVHAPLSASLSNDIDHFDISLSNLHNSNIHVTRFNNAIIPEVHGLNNTQKHSDLFGMLPSTSVEEDFDALVNLDGGVMSGGIMGGSAGANSWNFDDGGVHGFTMDMNWLGGTATGTDSVTAE